MTSSANSPVDSRAAGSVYVRTYRCCPETVVSASPIRIRVSSPGRGSIVTSAGASGDEASTSVGTPKSLGMMRW